MLGFFQKILDWIDSKFGFIPSVPLPEQPLTPMPPTPKDVPDLSKWGLVPELEALAVSFLIECKNKGYDLRITQGLRTMAEQQALYNQGRTKPGVIVTNAKPGESYHNFGKAFDVCFNGLVPYPNDDAHWRAIADIGKNIGLIPGYYFHGFQDKPHFEIH